MFPDGSPNVSMQRANRRDVLAATSSAAGLAALGGVATAGRPVAGRTRADCGAGTFEGGDGTTSSPYRIATVEQLQCVRADLDAAYELVDHVDASGVDFEPIGSPDERFAGTLYGNGYEVRGLTVDRPEMGPVGLFAFLDGGRLVDVNLVDATVVGERQAGALVGWMAAGSSVEGSSATGSVAGGISVGGLVGVASRGTISRSSASCDVVARDGLSRSRPDNAGGLVGSHLAGEIARSFADGSASANRYVGGLVGVSRASGSNAATVTDSYALTDVSGERSVGGLVGSLGDGTVSASYAAGNVTGLEAVGGLAGSSDGGTVTDAYWDVEATGQDDSAGGTGLVTAEMAITPSKDMQGFDFEETWYSSQADTYPRLRWERGPEVELAAVEPVQVVYENPALEGPDHVLVDDKETAVLLDLRIENVHELEGSVTVELDGTVEGPVEHVPGEDEDWGGSLLPQSVEVSKSQLQRVEDADVDYLEGVLEGFPLAGTVEHPFEGSSRYSLEEGTGVLEVTITPPDGPPTTEEVRIDVVETEDVDLRFYRQRRTDERGVDGVGDTEYWTNYANSISLLRETFPVNEDGLSASREGGFDLESGTPLLGGTKHYSSNKAGAVELLADLEQRAYVDGDGGESFGVGVLSPDGKAYFDGGPNDFGGGFTIAKDQLTLDYRIAEAGRYSQMNSVLVVADYWVSLAHELGHQFGLHNDLEEYKYPGEFRSDQRADGYRVEARRDVTNAIPFMGTASPKTLEDYWLSNSCDYGHYSEGPSPADDEGAGDHFDYDELLAAMSHRSLRDGYDDECGSDTSPSVATDGGVAHRSTSTRTPPEPTDEPDEPVDQVLYLKGSIGRDGDVETRGWRRYEDATPTGTLDGDYAFVATDGDDETILEKRFSVGFRACSLSEDGFADLDRAPYSFAMEYPPEAERLELRRDGETLDSFDARVELLRGAVDSVPADAYESSADAEQCYRDLHGIVDEFESELAGEEGEAATVLREEFRPAVDRCLRDDYGSDDPLDASKAAVLETTDEVSARVGGDGGDGMLDRGLAVAAGAVATVGTAAYVLLRRRNDDAE